jgi:hypothetical protein
MHSGAPFKWNLSVIFLHSNITMIAYLLLLISSMFTLPSLHSGLAQESSFVTSKPVIKILVGDAIKTLNNDNLTKALQNLNVVSKMMDEANENLSSLQAMRLLVHDAVDAMKNNDTSRGLVYLNLVEQQLGVQQSKNETIIAGSNTTTNAAAATTFLTYKHPTAGIKIQYPNNWSVIEYNYNSAGNNTIVGFYSPSKTASQLGNISGVSGHFVPYVDIYNFNSQNKSLNEIVNERLNRIRNNPEFILNDSKPLTLTGNLSAYDLIYTTKAGGNELFKKMQVYTELKNKVYLLSFTSQEALFPNYLPTVRKIIDSMEIGNSTMLK